MNWLRTGCMASVTRQSTEIQPVAKTGAAGGCAVTCALSLSGIPLKTRHIKLPNRAIDMLVRGVNDRHISDYFVGHSHKGTGLMVSVSQMNREKLLSAARGRLG